MRIHEKNFQMEKVPLATVRPFIIRDVVLADEGLDPERAKEDDVRRFLTEQAEEMIAEAQNDFEAAKAKWATDCQGKKNCEFSLNEYVSNDSFEISTSPLDSKTHSCTAETAKVFI